MKTKYKGNQNAAKLKRIQKTELREKLHQYNPDEILPPDVRKSQGEFWTTSDLKIAITYWYGVTYQIGLTQNNYKTGGFSPLKGVKTALSA